MINRPLIRSIAVRQAGTRLTGNIACNSSGGDSGIYAAHYSFVLSLALSSRVLSAAFVSI